jgi:hypothetical protein
MSNSVLRGMETPQPPGMVFGTAPGPVVPGGVLPDWQTTNSMGVLNPSQFQVDVTVGAHTPTAAQFSGAEWCVLQFSGNTTTYNVTTPSAAAIVAAIPGAYAGEAYTLRIVNANTSTGTVGLIAGAGVTFGSNPGPLAISAFRDYIVTLTNVTAGSQAVNIQPVGTGTAP